ncbi:MAG: hypothetical protein HKL90_06150 [Elusimicrobia bacterium]|nr:hypothetical protein [Elusimicrobiota bacterium]
MRRHGDGLPGLIPLLAALAVLAAFSARLSATRVYQVDECYNVAQARRIASGLRHEALTDPAAFIVALSGLERGPARARDLFARGRRAMLALFWLNLVLIAACTGERVASRRGLLVLLAAACLAPLWDYGLEIRHDNLLLTGLLLTWYVLRVRPGGRRAYFAAGALAALLQFVAFKAFVYTLPLSAAFLLFVPPGHRAPRRALFFSWAAGVVLALAFGRAVYGALGLWPAYLADASFMSAASAHVTRLPPLEAFVRFFIESPLLLAVFGAALFAAVHELRRDKISTALWDGFVPEAALAAAALAALLVNPRAYAYNLLNLMPFAFLAAYRYLSRSAAALRERPELAWSLALLLYALPFAAAVVWESVWTNARQTRVMDAAEALTGPDDPVYDGVGLVPTRPSVGERWLLDTLNIRAFVDGSAAPAREELARNPPAVVLPNYRTDWLPLVDRAFIAEHYVPLSDDFWTLGADLPPGGGSFDVLRAGRYTVAGLNGAGPPAGARLDGAPFSGGAAALALGRHRLRVAANVRAAVVWTGPRLDAPPRLTPRDHRLLFVDWY